MPSRYSTRKYRRFLAKEEKNYRASARGSLACLDVLQGRLSRPAEDIAKAMAPGGDLAGRTPEFSTAYFYLKAKKYDQALEIINPRLKRYADTGQLLGQRIALWWKGLVSLERKDIAEATKTAAELKSLAEQSVNNTAVRYYDHLQGLIDLKNRDYAKAVDNLERACGLLPYEAGYFSDFNDVHALFFYPRAFAYYKSGNPDKARTEFERIARLTTGRFAFGDLYAKSFYWLGKIAEEQRDKRRAVENYTKFLDLWKDADPGQAEVDEARNRLADLGKQARTDNERRMAVLPGQ